MKAEPQIDLELKKVYEATIEIMASAQNSNDGRRTRLGVKRTARSSMVRQ